MKRLLIISIIFSCAIVFSQSESRVVTPPYWGTIFVDPDIITEDDVTTFIDAPYAGQGMRTMFDRRVNGWITVNAYLFNATFDDSLTSEIQVNPEFGSSDTAFVYAERYGIEIGRLPTVLRDDVETVWIHQGTQPFGGGNNNLLIHTGQALDYIDDGILEEALIHEAAHTSLDSDHASSAGWLSAQTIDGEFISTYAQDNPTQEDIAESFLLYLAIRYRSDRITQSTYQTITQTIPNRIQYFDDQSFNMYPTSLPVVANPLSDITVNEDAPNITLGDLKNVFLDVDEELIYSHVVNDTGMVFVSVTNDTVTLQFLADANGSTEIIFTATNPLISASVSDTMIVTILPVNDLPLSFSLNEQDSVYITVANFASDSIVFTWGESSDVDEDVLTYQFTASLMVNWQVIAEYDSSSLTGRIMKIDHQSVFDEIFAAQAMLAGIVWNVSVTDGVAEVTSENGTIILGINASAAVLTVNEKLLPEVFALHQNYPNPFNPVTALRYDLPENGLVTITIYDMLGRKVRTILNQQQDPGYKSLIWDATN
ncbi:uncharacterized protein METZ01_LOCUS201696, partial [marine metagenome]